MSKGTPTIDPALLIMKNVSDFSPADYIGDDSVGEPQQPAPKVPSQKPSKEASSKPAPQRETKKTPSTVPPLTNGDRTTVVLSKNTATRFRIAKQAYSTVTGERLSSDAFLLRLLDTAMKSFPSKVSKVEAALRAAYEME